MTICYKLSPQRADKKLLYKFNVEKENVEIRYQDGNYRYINNDNINEVTFDVKEEVIEIIDLSFLQKGQKVNAVKTKLPVNPIIEAWREQDETLKVVLLGWYGPEHTIEDRYPPWFKLESNDPIPTLIQQPLNPYDSYVLGGGEAIVDLLAQVDSMVSNFNFEYQRIMQDVNAVSTINIRALKTFIIIVQFSVLESMSNFLGDLTLLANQGIESSPKIVSKLNLVEIDFLSDQKSELDKNGQVKTKKTFASTLDKICIAPLLLAKLHGIDFNIDKSAEDWQNVVKLKEIRDNLTHPKISLSSREVTMSLNIDRVKPCVIVKNEDLFLGAKVLRWYIDEITKLMRNLERSNQVKISFPYNHLELFSYRLLSKLYYTPGMSHKQFERKYPTPSFLVPFFEIISSEIKERILGK